MPLSLPLSLSSGKEISIRAFRSVWEILFATGEKNAV